MLSAIILGAVLFIGSSLFHFAVLSRTMGAIRASKSAAGVQHFFAISIVGLAHVTEAGIYTIGFLVGDYLNIGGFKPDAPQSVMDIYYFSIVNYTTLGLGDIYPADHFRLLAGIQSLNGFLMLSCSASFLYMITNDSMQKQKARIEKS